VVNVRRRSAGRSTTTAPLLLKAVSLNLSLVGRLSAREDPGMTVAQYRITELDFFDRVVDSYSIICRSDAAAVPMATDSACNRAAAIEVWESTRRVARFKSVTPWDRVRSRWGGSGDAAD
jgi:hypothetical protein